MFENVCHAYFGICKPKKNMVNKLIVNLKRGGVVGPVKPENRRSHRTKSRKSVVRARGARRGESRHSRERAVWGTSEGLRFPRVVSQRSCLPQTPWHFSKELTEEERKGAGFTEGGRRGRKKSPHGGRIGTRRDGPKLRVLRCRRHSQHRGLEQKREDTGGAWQESGGVKGSRVQRAMEAEPVQDFRDPPDP